MFYFAHQVGALQDRLHEAYLSFQLQPIDFESIESDNVEMMMTP